MRRLGPVVALLVACSSSPPPPPVGMPPPKHEPPFTVGGFSITLPAMTLVPGDETQPCWIFPVELIGPSRIVGGAKLVAPTGMHHGNVTSRPSTGEGVRECDPDD